MRKASEDLKPEAHEEDFCRLCMIKSQFKNPAVPIYLNKIKVQKVKIKP